MKKTPRLRRFLRLFPERARLGDEQGKAEVVLRARDALKALRLKGRQDRLCARAARKITVVKVPVPGSFTIESILPEAIPDLIKMVVHK